VDIRQKDYLQHEDFPKYAYNKIYNIYQDKHREFIHIIRTNAKFIYYRNYKCEIINCIRYNKESSSGEEEYFDI
jgi:hypothetical protein